MEPEKTTENMFCVWIDETNRVISFKRIKGYYRFSFPTREMMLAYVMEKGTSGYRIQ